MPRSRKDIRSLLAIFGVVILLATTVITLGTARPTEATWQDTVHGSSSFSAVQHPDEDKTFARYAGVYGEVIRVAGNSSQLGHAPTTVAPPSPLLMRADNNWTSEDAGTFFRAQGEHFNCGRRDNSPGVSCAHTGHEDSDAKSFAVAQVQNFRAHITAVLLPIRLVRLGNDQPTVATAACTPGRTGVATLSGGQLSLGSGLNPQRFDLPGPGEYVELNRDILGYDYTGYLHHDYEVRENYARSQLRLYLQATGELTELTPWTVHVVLAHAECGTRMDPTAPPSRPGLADPRGTARPSIHALDSNGATAESTTSAQPTARPTSASPTTSATKLPSTAPATATSTTTTSEPGTSEPTTSAPETGAAETTNSAQTEQPPTESSKPTTSTEAPAGPQRPQDVRVGREFAVTTREGVELGAARIEDVTRLPDCGVEITLEITTSAEDGPERWASIDHRDFAEVRPGGSTRPAQRASSECAGPAATAPAQLRVGDVHEVVVVIQISDTAQRAMLRPAGTAGWRFDLPPLPTTTATAPATTTAAGETAAARPSPPAPATTHASASPQESAVASAP